MTKTTIRFILDAVRGSEFDLWQPVKGGPSKIRPASATESYWAGHRVDRAKLREFTEALWRELELPNDSCLTEIDLDSPKLPALVARLAELKQAGLVQPVRGTVEIKLVDTPEEPCQWFELHRFHDCNHIKFVKDKLVDQTICKADQAPRGTHLAGQYVSEKFKATVENAGFRGIEFRWIQDIGKYAAPQWYMPVAIECLGRGIDHEFYDNQKYLGSKSNPHITKPEARIGVSTFRANWLKTSTPFANQIQNELLALFPDYSDVSDARTDGVWFLTYMTFLREFLPDSDFAHPWRCETVCFNRRVKAELISHGVVTEEDCIPIKILDKAPAYVEVLDGLPGSPRPYSLYSDQELTRWKLAEEAWKTHIANPKPKRPASDMQRALELLKMARNIISPRPNTADVDAAARELGDRFPQKWQEVLRLTDAFEMDLGGSFYIEPANNLEEYTKSIQESWFAGKVDFTNKYLHITSGGNGDFHSLDLSTCTPDGDCRVLQFSHETLQPEREWDGIAEFVQEIAETMLAETDDE
jgi:hypothetical protein